ncbi:group II intron reverse transcriptase/maturase [Escherichia coli]|uniref:group II intron reverse transcriptase/maturase n=1 Tax=Escherichia coli TaxID=562 RepID=UPI001127E60E|nr:group II intron reverse transcriptase/maturase [Escherichia coli]NNU05553.1 group II intron reverse transcriptase/maturase [Escherichia coli]TPV75246.1 group II intron reverse transcriptase/maturase [Escherichia coli]
MMINEAQAQATAASGRGDGRYSSGLHDGAETSTAADGQTKAEVPLTTEAVITRENLMLAYQRVVELKPSLKKNRPSVRQALTDGNYQPRAIRRMDIPKPDGGVRTLGIPTVLDRLIQQAIAQQLSAIVDKSFSDSSYGFRPGRSAWQAVQQAQRYIRSGKWWVVDMDLEKFFDRVAHRLLMTRLARTIKDRRVLRLIRRYLKSEMVKDGQREKRQEGMPQGGPLSPLLSNILLDEIRGFVENKLKLKVNEKKSAVARPWERRFLGYSVTWHKQAKLKIALTSVNRLKEKVRSLTTGNRSKSVKATINVLTPVLRGWISYFRLTEVRGVLEELDGWIKRKLRCLLWRQWKRPGTRTKNLQRAGLSKDRAMISAYNNHGPWWNSGASHMNQAIKNAWFRRLGLISLLEQQRQFQS